MSQIEKPFIFPIRRLANDRLSLEPFNLTSHACVFVEGTKNHPDLFKYVTYGPFQSVKEFEDEFYWLRVGEKEGTALWSIFTKNPTDKVERDGDWVFAGVLSLDNSNRINGVAEIGHVRMVLSSSIPVLLLIL